jgi:hypothetical protein
MSKGDYRVAIASVQLSIYTFLISIISKVVEETKERKNLPQNFVLTPHFSWLKKIHFAVEGETLLEILIRF